MSNEFQQLSANDVVRSFFDRLVDKKEDLATVASLWNGFEGWLKFELAIALAGKASRRPWTGPEDAAEWNTLGVEYKAGIDGRQTRAGVLARKQLDLWVCSSDGERWHAVELKVAFSNRNGMKQVASWRADLDLMRGLSDKTCDGRIAILIAVGFTEAALVAHDFGSHALLVGERGAGPDWTPSVHLVAAINERGRDRTWRNQ